MYIYLVLVITIFFGYFFHRIFSPRKEFRGLVIIYWAKWAWKVISIKIWQLNLPVRVNSHDPTVLSFENSGVVPTDLDVQMESPKTLITDRHEDCILIWGGDSKGRAIFSRVVRLSRNRASVFLMVKDQEGNLYTLPNQPDSNVVNIANDQSWRGNGLLLECVEPMRTWRLKFNGLLRKGTRDHYITHDHDDDDDRDDEATDGTYRKVDVKETSHIQHVRIDFLWKALKNPVDIWRDSSARLLAHSLARESFTDWSAFKALDRDGYDQWGVLHGTIRMGNESPQKWYLRGARQHRWGMSDSATTLQNAVTLFSMFTGGDMICLEAFSYNSAIHHCVMGYLLTSSGKHIPLTSTSLELPYLFNRRKESKNIFVTCRGGRKKFDLWWRLFDGISFFTGDPWTLKHKTSVTHSASTVHGDGFGLSFITKRYNELCPVPEKENFQLPVATNENSQENLLVVPLSDVASTSVPLTGGKGSSLAFLKYIERKISDQSIKFTVPNGIILTSHSWVKQINFSPELKNSLLHLEKAVTSSHLSRIRDSCAKTKAVIDGIEICPETRNLLKDELTKMFPNLEELNLKKFAVRSSGCGEDSKEASSAGQNETILGCRWKENDATDPSSVLRALITCWGSQFSFQSVEYRRQRGQEVNGGMAIVIQEMVDAHTAGVMFTREPLNGSPATITIAANYGLGESVVGATAEPDTIEVRRTWRNKLKIKSRKVGQKKSKYVMKESGGTSEIEVSEGERSMICMNDDNALKLAKIGILIEDYFGSSRDIEFALNQNRVYLLQARPLTFLEEWTDYELMHEMDTGFISDKEISTIANIGEVFPGYITPLTRSSVVKMMDITLQRVLYQRELSRNSYSVYHNKIMIVFNGQCLLNLGELFYRLVENKITFVNHAIDLGVFGRLVTTPEILRWAIDRFGSMSIPSNLYRTAYSFFEMFLNPRRVRRLQPYFSAYEIEAARAHSAEALYREISRKLSDLFRINELHCHTSSASSMTQCIALVALGQDTDEINLKVIQDMATLLGCISDSESAEIPVSLKNLAKVIAENEEVEEFLQMTPDEGRVWLESHPESVGNVFRDFLHKHGHRCIKEFDLCSKSWGLAPETLVKTLQTMVKNPLSFQSPKKNLDIDHVLDSLNTPVDRSKKRVLKFILRLCGNAVRLRETTKSLAIKTIDSFRRAYRILGQLMVSECRLPDAELVFFLQHKEIGVLLETRSVSIVTKAIRRRKLMSRMKLIQFPEISFGIPSGENEEEEVSFHPGTDVIKGTPVCNGIAKGTAKVITSLEEASEIQNGDILITFCTDVGWTPYFPLLAGVVTEIGGLISHGAVVAREYGLPCVVGAKGATTKVNSGDKVLINGGEGYIKIISDIKKT